jgi:hypothetical protein
VLGGDECSVFEGDECSVFEGCLLCVLTTIIGEFALCLKERDGCLDILTCSMFLCI